MTLKQSIQRLRDKIKDSPELELADEEILVQNKDGVDKLIHEIRIGTIVACHALAYCKRTDDRSILRLVDDFNAKVSALSIDDAISKQRRWW